MEIRPEWAVIEQIPFQSLVKLNCAVGEPEDVMRCGELEYYDKVGVGVVGECACACVLACVRACLVAVVCMWVCGWVRSELEVLCYVRIRHSSRLAFPA